VILSSVFVLFHTFSLLPLFPTNARSTNCALSRPLAGGSMDDYLRDSVPIEKDVEGLCHTYRHNLYHNIRYVDTQTSKYKGGIVTQTGLEGTKKCLLPCTPLAIIKILEYLKVCPCPFVCVRVCMHADEYVHIYIHEYVHIYIYPPTFNARVCALRCALYAFMATGLYWFVR